MSESEPVERAGEGGEACREEVVVVWRLVMLPAFVRLRLGEVWILT